MVVGGQTHRGREEVVVKIIEGNRTNEGANGLVDGRPIDRAKRVAVGLCFIIFPAIWVFAFAVHPDLADPRILTAEELITRAHGDGLLQFAHALVTLNTAVLVVLTLHFMKLLDRTSAAWAGLVGAAMAVLGACLLAADKGALCLTMSALDTLPESEFAQMMPGLLAMFSFKGWMVLVWGLLLMPIGVAIQTIAMMKTKTTAQMATLVVVGRGAVRRLPRRRRDHQFERGCPDGSCPDSIRCATRIEAARANRTAAGRSGPGGGRLNRREKMGMAHPAHSTERARHATPGEGAPHTQRTLVIILSQIVTIVALVVLWSILRNRRKGA